MVKYSVSICTPQATSRELVFASSLRFRVNNTDFYPILYFLNVSFAYRGVEQKGSTKGLNHASEITTMTLVYINSLLFRVINTEIYPILYFYTILKLIGSSPISTASSRVLSQPVPFVLGVKGNKCSTKIYLFCTYHNISLLAFRCILTM